MIQRRETEKTEEELAYERYVLSIWQRIVVAVWRWRTDRAFDARDKHPMSSWQWKKANERVERRFK